ncbi:hypothetical protein DOY81_004288 [Sarcophaga bullata]|nr:hypothetical protein DOY81_004288 [Sarcophaga bullata]
MDNWNVIAAQTSSSAIGRDDINIQSKEKLHLSIQCVRYGRNTLLRQYVLHKILKPNTINETKLLKI